MAISLLVAPSTESAAGAVATPSASPQPIWVDQFGASEAVWLQDVATDADGDVYAVGQSRQRRSGVNWFVGYVRATTGAGVELWVDEFGEPGSAIAHAVAASDDGHLFVVGDRGSGREPDRDSVGFVRAYSPAGQTLWANELPGPASYRPRAVAVSKSGTVYVAGARHSGQQSVGFLHAYSAAGEELWTKRLTATNGIGGVAVDRDGTVYVTGNTSGALPGQTSQGDRDGFVRAYSPTGQTLWTDQFGTADPDYAYGIDVGPDGSVHILGISAFTHSFVRTYSSAGVVAWNTRWSDEHDMSGAGIAVDGDGVVYVAGNVIVVPAHCDPHCRPPIRDGSILALSDTGEVIWTNQFGTDDNDEVAAIAARRHAELVVGGLTLGVFPSQPPSTPSEIDSAFIMKLEPPMCRGLAATLVGTPDGGVVTGTAGRDVIVGGIGNDTVHGRAGDDVICGGTGDDTVFAGLGADMVLGQRGDDTVRGGDGPDLVAGNKGSDQLTGNGGHDVVRAGTGDDRLNGGFGGDHLYGADGRDRLIGSGGDDAIDGGAGPDQLLGGNGDDRLRGSSGDDVLQGRAGDDTLEGGLGRDRCNGGPGTNTLRACEVVRTH